METKRSISDFIKEAEGKKMQLVIVGEGSETGAHAQMLARLKMKPDVMIVNVGDLTEEDQKKISEDKPLPIQEVIPYKLNPIPLESVEPIITYDDLNKPAFAGFKNKKFKGYMKNNKSKRK